MKFFNKTTSHLEVKDEKGTVILGPFLPGTAEKGPWYDIYMISDDMIEIWVDRNLIEMVES